MRKYAKAVAATVGAGATAALGIFAPHSLPWNIAEALVALTTVLSVYGVSNGPTPPAGVTGTYVGGK